MRAPVVAWFYALLAMTMAWIAPGGAHGAERRATVFYTGGVHGAIEPCGCTSDPLGDVARMTGVVRRAAAAARKAGSGVLLVDAGNLLYPVDDVSPRRREAADLRAAFLAGEFQKLPFGGSALGDADLSGGIAQVRPPRLAANVEAAGAPFLTGSYVTEIGGIKIGLLGVTDADVARRAGLRATDPAPAAKREADRLRAQGAEIVIVLAALERPAARQIARAAAVDFVILGRNVGDGLPRADRVGDAYVVAAATELQRIGRLDIVLRDPSPTAAPTARRTVADAGGGEAVSLRRNEIERTLKDVDADLTRWAKSGGGGIDAAFVASKRRERDELAAEQQRLAQAKWAPPATGDYFANQLIPLQRALPRDAGIAAAMRRLDAAVGRANLKQAQPPPRADAGRATFAGVTSCASCHKAQVAFWKTTVHAHAWKTLVDGGKTGHDDCVSCHVTGYGEIGGSSLGFTRNLEAVQCETCHGPGSLHVKADGLEDPPAVQLATPESTCTTCHNQKHSDTFRYDAYLRDILGPGHGEGARKKLGVGPTGRELRQAAKAKAKAAGAALVRGM